MVLLFKCYFTGYQAISMQENVACFASVTSTRVGGSEIVNCPHSKLCIVCTYETYDVSMMILISGQTLIEEYLSIACVCLCVYKAVCICVITFTLILEYVRTFSRSHTK